jgi:hypothetical protein
MAAALRPPDTVVLSEDLQPEHLASEHHAAQPIERVGWAVAEAKEAEGRSGLRRTERASRSPRYLADLQACNVGRVNADRTIGAVLGEPGETRLT